MRSFEIGSIIFFILVCGELASPQAAQPVRSPATINPPFVETIPEETAAELTSLAHRAGVIFAGQVVAIEHHESTGYVDIVFHVDTAIRGCGAGANYILREWAGLWERWPGRFAVGQRRLMLLSSRGPSGLSSPVGGMLGMIPIVGTRQPPLMNGNYEVPPETATERTEDEVDLRWVQAHQVRAAAPVAENAVEKSGGAAKWRGPVARLPAAPTDPIPRAVLSAVLALLGDQGTGGVHAR